MARATGIGSLPGTDIREALRGVRDLLGDGHLPYLPELPARGPGSELLGRSAGLLVDLHVDLQPGGWRFVDRPGHDAGRTAGLWRQDLDELAEAFDGYAGELKVQCAGPWTLAAGLELTRGERALSDQGAVRDLVGSLTEGLRRHVAEVQRLVPQATLTLQLDEPSLPAVLAGHIPTASGYGHLRSVDPMTVMNGLRDVLGAAPDATATVVHCCDPGIPLPLLRATGVAAIAFDTTTLTPQRWESVAATVEQGVALWAGCLPTDGGGTVQEAAATVARGWHDAGMPTSALGDLVASPACGLAGLTPAGAWRVQRAAVDVAAEWSERAES
ncbi:methionine synthase [Nostocoides sp. HKS02]|uniref:methionine synthase n=1 Tax=Nostocoides sp. HKS02 TaxID=1813880 RepID=UPI0012B4F2DF|nr:methionine synthase [Tetrasphaera sp. HKS02]QGN56791.1 methionine synthase [Tetrasphaera sp. HKS02]